MCGIVALLAYGNDPCPSRDELFRVRDRLRDRGPDSSGAWFSAEGRVAIGHRRLYIFDLSDAGNQPMVSGDGRLVVVFNGEIYNYRELRASRLPCTFGRSRLLDPGERVNHRPGRPVGGTGIEGLGETDLPVILTP